MAGAAAVKERVPAYLTSVGPVQVDGKGRYSPESGSTRTFVEVMPHPDGKGVVLLRHLLMGDCLDKDELLCVAFGITGVADGLDERLTEQFGGKTYGES
ncbi:MAG: hypothetical protein ACYC2Z_05705 [Candidatus Nanopelagicales bacterium]